MRTDEIRDAIDNCHIGDTDRMLTIMAAMLERIEALEIDLAKESRAAKRTADVASCLANGIQPD